jgi:RHS repeat-associated protein
MARHWEPASSLYQVRARWYDPEVGRFISEDPINLAGGINQYVYAGNNPVDFTDPYGLFTLPKWVSAVAFVGTLGFASAGNLTFGEAFWGTVQSFSATAVGSAMAAAVEAGFTEASFEDAFFRTYGISTGFLAGGAALSHLIAGGVTEAGANTWYQGYIRSAKPILGQKGGMTIGSAAVFSETDRGFIDEVVGHLGTHEAGHTIQFMMLPAITGRSPWGPYAVLGVAGMSNNVFGNWWENFSSRLGRRGH